MDGPDVDQGAGIVRPQRQCLPIAYQGLSQDQLVGESRPFIQPNRGFFRVLPKRPVKERQGRIELLQAQHGQPLGVEGLDIFRLEQERPVEVKQGLTVAAEGHQQGAHVMPGVGVLRVGLDGHPEAGPCLGELATGPVDEAQGGPGFGEPVVDPDSLEIASDGGFQVAEDVEGGAFTAQSFGGIGMELEGLVVKEDGPAVLADGFEVVALFYEVLGFDEVGFRRWAFI